MHNVAGFIHMNGPSLGPFLFFQFYGISSCNFCLVKKSRLEFKAKKVLIVGLIFIL